MNLLSFLSTVNSLLGGSGHVRASMIVSSEKTTEKIVFPVVPNPLPTVSVPQANEVFNAIDGDKNLVGDMGLRSVSFEALLPGRDVSFAARNSSSTSDILDFLDVHRRNKDVMRLAIVLDNGDDYINMPCLIGDMSYVRNKMGDYRVSLTFTEYVYVIKSTDAQTAGGSV